MVTNLDDHRAYRGIPKGGLPASCTTQTARYDNDLLHRWFQGMCGLITGCTTGEDTLKMFGNGEFIKNGSTTTTMGDPGLGPFTYAGSYPPDEHGTYEVLLNGRIHLAFADGTAKDYTFAVLTDKAGQPDPVVEGVMLDEDDFYKEVDYSSGS